VLLPTHGGDIELAAIQCPQSHDPSQPFLNGKAERHVERHPVPDQVKAIHQIGVPDQFPTTSATCVSGVGVSARAVATAAIPSSPSRETMASI